MVLWSGRKARATQPRASSVRFRDRRDHGVVELLRAFQAVDERVSARVWTMWDGLGAVADQERADLPALPGYRFHDLVQLLPSKRTANASASPSFGNSTEIIGLVVNKSIIRNHIITISSSI